MGATASLSVSTLTIEPGQSAVLDVLVRNNGAVVDEMTLRILGEAAGWAVLEPPSLSLFPQTEGTVRVTFSPPRASTPAAGTLPFGVMVSSREDSEGSVVEEGTIEVLAFTDTFAELVPHARQARHAAGYRLAVDNRGNVDVAPSVAGTSPTSDLAVEVRPTQVDIPRGTTVFLRVTANASHWMWKGHTRTHPFALQVATDRDVTPFSVDGVMLQDSILPSWFMKALILVLALILAAVALWYGLLRPSIRNQARAVAKQQTAKNTKQVHKAVMAAQQAKKSAGSANKAAGSATKAAGSAAKQASTAAQAATKATGKPFATTTTTVPGGPSTTPTGGRVVLTVPPGKTMSSSLAGIPAKKSFELTDIIFENPDGDSGTVSIMRGSSVVLFENLSTFRDLDYHFVSPISFPAGTKVTFSATCDNPASAKVSCQPAVYLGGYLG